MSRLQIHFATCAPGLEAVLHQEIRELGFARVERQVGGVHFEGTERETWLANLWLRTAVRVLRRIDRFAAPHADALYEGVASVDWSRYLADGGTLRVDARSRDSDLDHTRFIEQTVKDAVVDQIRQRTGERPSVDLEDADLTLSVHIFRDRATLSLDTTGGSLHKRGWRVHQARAPLSETLAAAVLRLSGWDRRSPLVDPFCGSGTFLVEAALLAQNMAPGLFRERFGFENLPDHDAKGFAREKEKARAQVKPTRKLRLVGSDLNPEFVEATSLNLNSAGVGELATLECRSALDWQPKSGWNAWVVCNPPWGERVGDEDRLFDLYRSFGAKLRDQAAGYHLALLSGNPRLAKVLGLNGLERTRIANGQKDCELWHGALPEGPANG